VREGRWAEGGSTLTQQLTKILFLRPEKTLRRKIQEAMLAVQIEKTYTKEEILAFYLNQINFGHGRYGVEAAAQFYFGKSASDLSVEQGALLAGLIQRPAAYSPVRYPERAAQRRNKVLERMAEEGYISPEDAKKAQAMPVEVVQAPPDNSIAPYFAEEIRKLLAPTYGDESILRDGMAIHTGLDVDLQRAANVALSKGLRDLDKRRGFRRPAHNIVLERAGTLDNYQHPRWDHFPVPGEVVYGLVMRVAARQASIRIGKTQSTLSASDAEWTGRTDLTRLLRPGDLTLFEVRAVHDDGTLELTLDQEPEVEGAVLALDPRTGDIKAMVGGFDFQRSQFNRAAQAQRQCGSAFKPFIYTLAIEEGRSPSELLFDQPTVFMDPQTGEGYQPENYERTYEGVVTMRRALEHSINIPTVALLNEVGYQRTVEFAHRMGVTSELHAYPSLALGSSEVSLMELTAAYGVYPTGGLLSSPRYFSDVRDREGNVLEETRAQSKEVLRADVAAVMVSMMQGVVQRGTAAAAARPGVALAGKTGTTDDYTDAWFIGYTPSLVLGVWVGNDRKVTLGRGETGAKAALPIWSSIIDTWTASHPGESFPVNPDTVTLPVDHETGLREAPDVGCHTVIMETFVKGTEIEHPCTLAAHHRLSLPYYLQRYKVLSEGRVEIPEEEIQRLLRENPSALELVGRTTLNVLGSDGVRVVRLSRGGGEISDIAWGFIRRSERSASDEDEEAAYAQFLPAMLPPISSGPGSFVGVDGRSAATVKIQYP